MGGERQCVGDMGCGCGSVYGGLGDDSCCGGFGGFRLLWW